MTRRLPLLEKTLEKLNDRLGPDNVETMKTRNNLVTAYFEAKEPAKAVPLMKDYLAVKRKEFGSTDPRFALEMTNISMLLMKNQQHAAAESILRECLEIRLKTQREAWTTYNTKSMLGDSLLGQMKYQDAEPLLKEGYEGMRANEKTPPQGLTEALGRLVRFSDATGNAAEADRWRKELAAHKAAEKASMK